MVGVPICPAKQATSSSFACVGVIEPDAIEVAEDDVPGVETWSSGFTIEPENPITVIEG
jgi:hypothetical protein